MIQSAFPIIVTADLPRALGFWRDLLGGQVSYQFPPDGEPDYVGVELGTSHLGIGVDPSFRPAGAPRPISIWCYVTDCDAAVEGARGAGLAILEEPVDQPWGERVARVSDPDGNTVILGSKG